MRGPNAETLTNGKFYVARLIGLLQSDGKTAWMAIINWARVQIRRSLSGVLERWPVHGGWPEGGVGVSLGRCP